MHKRIPIALGFVLLALALWALITPVHVVQLWLGKLNAMAYDLQLKTRLLTHPTHSSSPIAIVDIDDKSLAAIGRWPWSRDKLALLISELHQQGAVVIALDILLAEQETNIVTTVADFLAKKQGRAPIIQATLKQIAATFDKDAQLANVIRQNDVVLGMTLSTSARSEGILPSPTLQLDTPALKALSFFQLPGYISSFPALAKASTYNGFLNAFPDADGIIRRAPLLLRYHDNVYPMLALEAVRLYLLSDIKLHLARYKNHDVLEGIQLGTHNIPTDATGQVIVPFLGKSFTFPYLSAIDVITHQIPADSFTGKIVFIGTSATGLGDLRATAIQGVFPGVEIQASVADGILRDHFSYTPPWALGLEIVFTAVLGIVLLLLFPFLGPRSLTLAILGIPCLLIFLNNMLWETTGLFFSILVPILLIFALALLNMMYSYLFETKRRERLKDMFGQYVPEKHIDEMLKSNSHYGLYGEDRDMTVLFADIRNFTTLSEAMPAAQLKEMLNQFFTPMTEVIFTHRGTIDKYIGDLIMAFWGAPLKDKNHAIHAMKAALAMQEKLTLLMPVFAAQGLPSLQLGIGLNSGIMSVGDMGSKFRRNYTVLGDAVNLASRVESLTKYYGVKIIVTEYTYKNDKQFTFRQLDCVRVKGKANSVTLYELVNLTSKLSIEQQHEINASNQAVALYLKQAWVAAEHAFAALQKQSPACKLYTLYLKRLRELQQNPPSPLWDGVYEHTDK